MGTSCVIAIKKLDGNFDSITVHYDGYSSHMVPLLNTHYTDVQKVKALIALGNCSVLDESINCPGGHSFADPIDGYSIFYHRDRGEEWEINAPVLNLSEHMFFHDTRRDIVYFFDESDNSWYKGIYKEDIGREYIKF